MPKLDEFTEAYITTALFTEHDDPTPGEYVPHGRWTIDNTTNETIADMVHDCQEFREKVRLYAYAHNLGRWTVDEVIEKDLAHAGRDFWYTRNGCGCGYWDGDWPEKIGEALTTVAKRCGPYDLYLGDDGHIHGGIY